jgi:hypothetical protein
MRHLFLFLEDVMDRLFMPGESVLWGGVEMVVGGVWKHAGERFYLLHEANGTITRATQADIKPLERPRSKAKLRLIRS